MLLQGARHVQVFVAAGSCQRPPVPLLLWRRSRRALSDVTFVSDKGTDAGACDSPAAPCRSFKFALGQTSPGGEIKALNPADYGGVTIAYERDGKLLDDFRIVMPGDKHGGRNVRDVVSINIE